MVVDTVASGSWPGLSMTVRGATGQKSLVRCRMSAHDQSGKANVRSGHVKGRIKMMQNHRAAWLRVSKRRLFGLGVLVALSLLLASGSAWAVSCAGSNACRNTDATIGEESCKGPNACRNNTGDPIEDGACLGKNSCRDNAGSIGDESCRGQGVCRSNLSSVGYKSCRGKDACKDNAAEVGDLSCAGKNACQESQGVIGNGSCRGKDACKGATADIGNGACIGARSCMNRSTPVGDGACRGLGRCAEEGPPAVTCPCDYDAHHERMPTKPNNLCVGGTDVGFAHFVGTDQVKFLRSGEPRIHPGSQGWMHVLEGDDGHFLCGTDYKDKDSGELIRGFNFFPSDMDTLAACRKAILTYAAEHSLMPCEDLTQSR